jgi:large subunit ribosomal protein L25
VLEHVTHQITIEALPTAIPESIAADVSGMSIGDTLQLSALIAPEGVEFAVDDPDEVTIATLSPPRVEEEPEPELEEDVELVGEEGEAPEGEEAPAEGETPAEAEGDGEGE